MIVRNQKERALLWRSHLLLMNSTEKFDINPVGLAPYK
jgi:hypothetical protein